MVVTTLTSNTYKWLAKLFSDDISTSATIIAVGTGTPTSSGLGAELTTNGFARGAGTINVTDGVLTISKVFTASGADITISESALYTTDSTPVLIGYSHYEAYELSNGGEVPDGQTITVTFTITPSIGTVSRTWEYENRDIYYAASVAISIADLTAIDPSGFSCYSGMCYNGRKITNGYINSKTEIRGGRTWEISGYTEEYADILALQAHATSLNITKTIEGYQYVNSILLSGTFRVLNKTTNTYTSYTYCWVDESIDVETFGDGWNFNLKIIQDYRGIIT